MSGGLDFFMHVKSTLDRMGNDLVTASSADSGANLDDTVNVDEIFKSDDSTILWQLVSVEEAPSDPLYIVQFAIGAKTTEDAGNYDLIAFQNEVNNLFHKNAIVDLYDYSQGAQTTKKGSMTITEAMLTPQEFDNESGIRMQVFAAKAFRMI